MNVLYAFEKNVYFLLLGGMLNINYVKLVDSGLQILCILADFLYTCSVNYLVRSVELFFCICLFLLSVLSIFAPNILKLFVRCIHV